MPTGHPMRYLKEPWPEASRRNGFTMNRNERYNQSMKNQNSVAPVKTGVQDLLKRKENTHNGFQFLEDLSTAYWYSEVLFAALELNLFDRIEQGNHELESLAIALDCSPEHLHRMMKALQGIGLIKEQEKGCWRNFPATRRYLLPESPDFMGNFLLYRKYIQNTWQNITKKLSYDTDRKRTIPSSAPDDYETRSFNYVRAMDELARQKAGEIAGLCSTMVWNSPILDIGGGAGAICRRLLQNIIPGEAFLLDLPEVIRAAKILYPKPEYWAGIQTVEGNFLTHEFQPGERFGTIIISNFLHIYNQEDAKCIVRKSVDLLRKKGLILIHDYFPDRTKLFPHKGLLYDINMMLNTCEGVCHDSSLVVSWLQEVEFEKIEIQDLPSDSSIILASINRDRV